MADVEEGGAAIEIDEEEEVEFAEKEDNRAVDLGDGLPPLPANGVDNYEDRMLFAKQRACLLMLLKAKALLSLRVAKEREKATPTDPLRPSLNELDAQGIHSIISTFEPGEDDADLLKRIQELKAQLVIELRRNHGLDRNLAKLDKRIALLIKNRGKVVTTTKKKEPARAHRREIRQINLKSKAIADYQDLFYLLQTEPRYLARVVYLVNPDQMDSFLDMTILTLYGEAFSPREEYLVLRLFQLAMQHEISVVSHISDFLQQETVVPKMIVAYNHRKLGLAYIQKVLGPVMNTVLEETERNMELSPTTIYINMINEQEIRSGQKTKLDRQVTPEQALENPEVKEIVQQRLNDLSDICKLFIDAILRSVNELPYGLRWICKQLSAISKEALPDSTELDIRRLIGYFVYYRFVNPAIVQPDSKQASLVKKELNPLARKSCVVISKVLQNLFNLRVFKEDNNPVTLSMMRLNPFLEEYFPKIENYFDALVKVDDPEDHLQVNKYMELTQKTKPMIQISLHEIFQTHQMIYQHLDKIATEKDDPLRRVMDDLGELEADHTDLTEEEDRDIQLTLTNRFTVDVEEESESEKRYAETKELLIPVLRMVPVKTTIQRLNLIEMLKYCQEFSKGKDDELSKKVDRIRENVDFLEKEGLMSRADNYEGFINDLGREVLNRNEIREQQKKEVARLETTLKNLRLHQTFLQDQTNEYNSYLDDVLQSLYVKPTKGGKANKQAQKIGPFKFTYKQLQKQGVLVSSEVPQKFQGLTSFLISSEEPGVFDIEAKMKAKSLEKMQLRFDALLERHYNNEESLELDQVTLDVNMTIHLINTLFMKKK